MSDYKPVAVKPVNPSLLRPTSVYLFLGYFLWPFSLFGLAIEKEDDFIRFHCAQGLAFFFLQVILAILLCLFSALVWLIVPILFVVIIYLAIAASYVLLIITLIKAAKGEKYKMILVGDFADATIKKWLLK